MRSLQVQLVFLWGMVLALCVALALAMGSLFASSAGHQIALAEAGAQGACASIAARYEASLVDRAAAAPQIDLLQVLLQLVLLERPGVEGGVWRAPDGFLAYAYPTYEGSGGKHDVPAAERTHIADVAARAVRRQAAESDVARASRDALIVVACPLHGPNADLAAWTMTRTQAGNLDAQRSLRWGIAGLIALVLASGLWLGTILGRGLAHVRRLEGALAQAPADTPQPVPPSGIAELDRVVAAVNRLRDREAAAQAALRRSALERARDQRLAALGRMAGGIAHEIRNPVAAMRLKAENALAAPPARQADALAAIVGQVGRVEAIVQSMLAVVQPLQLARVPVRLERLLREQADGVAAAAAARGVRVAVEADPALEVAADPLHLGRAVASLLDNAVRHARAGGTVRASAARRGERAVLRVADDGEGVAPAVAATLFEPFATGRPGGTGLGLALAREVALAHGGDLVLADAPAAGEGAAFELEIPWRTS